VSLGRKSKPESAPRTAPAPAPTGRASDGPIEPARRGPSPAGVSTTDLVLRHNDLVTELANRFVQSEELTKSHDREIAAENARLAAELKSVETPYAALIKAVAAGRTKGLGTVRLGLATSQELRNRFERLERVGTTERAATLDHLGAEAARRTIEASGVTTLEARFGVALIVGLVFGSILGSSTGVPGFFLAVAGALAIEWFRTSRLPLGAFDELAMNVGALDGFIENSVERDAQSKKRDGAQRLELLRATHRRSVDALSSQIAGLVHQATEFATQIDIAIPRLAKLAPESIGTPSDVGVLRLGQLQSQHASFPASLPNLWTFPASRSLLFAPALGDDADAATRYLHDLMSQMMATPPSGGVEFSCLDPVHLGDTFSAFTHLTDLTEGRVKLQTAVTQRDIEDLLIGMTRHIERVNTNYLRGTYKNIEEHNAVAGSGAIPYQIVVAVGLPSELSDIAFRALVKIAAVGARCGVYLLLAWDQTTDPSYGIELRDLAKECDVVVRSPLRRFDEYGRSGEVTGFGTISPMGADLPGWAVLEDHPIDVRVSGALDSTVFGSVLSAYAAGSRRRSSEAVQLGSLFERFNRTLDESPERFPHAVSGVLANDASTWWQQDSTHRLIAPIGRKGATDFRALEFGGPKDGSHSLIAGRTGYGKSVLLHAAINSLVMQYGPDQMRLHLLDMKDGVGFGIYGQGAGLPHLDVLGVHCPPEFALAALRGLEVEMHRRNELMTRATARYAVSVDDIVQYRTVTGEPMPRIVCVIDEFQELFSDDLMSSESNVVVGSIAKRGRSAGIHLMMATQSLSGIGLRTGTRAQFGLRMSLGVLDAEESVEIIGTGEAATISDVGVALIKSTGADLEEVKVAYVDKDVDLPRMTAVSAARAKADGFVSHLRIFDGRSAPRLASSAAVRRDLGLDPVPSDSRRSLAISAAAPSTPAKGPRGTPSIEPPPRERGRSGGGLTKRSAAASGPDKLAERKTSTDQPRSGGGLGRKVESPE